VNIHADTCQFIDGTGTDAIVHDGLHRVLVKFAPAAVKTLEKSSGLSIHDLSNGVTLKLRKYSLIVRDQVAHEDCIQLRIGECDLGKVNNTNLLSAQALPFLGDNRDIRKNLSAFAEPPRSQSRVIDVDDDDDVASYVAEAASQVSIPMTQAQFATQVAESRKARRGSFDLALAGGINLGPPLQPPVAKHSVVPASKSKHGHLLALLAQKADRGHDPMRAVATPVQTTAVKQEEISGLLSSAAEPTPSQQMAVRFRGDTVMVDVEDLAGSEESSVVSQHSETVEQGQGITHTMSGASDALEKSDLHALNHTALRLEQVQKEDPDDHAAGSDHEASSESEDDESTTSELLPKSKQDSGTVTLFGFDFGQLHTYPEKPVAEDQRTLLAKNDSNHYQAGATPFTGALVPIKLLDRLSKEVDQPFVATTERAESTVMSKIKAPQSSPAQPLQSSQPRSSVPLEGWGSSPIREAPRYREVSPLHSSPIGPPLAILRRPPGGRKPDEMPPDSSAAMSFSSATRQLSVTRNRSHLSNQDPRDTLANLQVRAARPGPSQSQPPCEASASIVPIQLATSYQASLPSDSDSSDIEIQAPHALPPSTSAKAKSQSSTNSPLAPHSFSQIRQHQQRQSSSARPSHTILKRPDTPSRRTTGSSQQSVRSSKQLTRSAPGTTTSAKVASNAPIKFSGNTPEPWNLASDEAPVYEPSPEKLVPGTFSSGVMRSFSRPAAMSTADGAMEVDEVPEDTSQDTMSVSKSVITQRSPYTHARSSKRPVELESPVQSAMHAKRQKSNNFDWDRPSQVEDPVVTSKRMREEFMEKRKNSRPAAHTGNETPTSAQAILPPQNQVAQVRSPLNKVKNHEYSYGAQYARAIAGSGPPALDASSHVATTLVPGLSLLNDKVSTPNSDQGVMRKATTSRHHETTTLSSDGTPQLRLQSSSPQQAPISANANAGPRVTSVYIPEATGRPSDAPLAEPDAPLSSIASENNASRMHNRFKQAYPAYSGDVKHFLGLCRSIQTLHDGSRLLHQSLWDDFIIRHRTDYTAYVIRCIHEGEAAKSYETYYQDEIEEPLYSLRIITSKTLQQVLCDPRSVVTVTTSASIPSDVANPASDARSGSARDCRFPSDIIRNHSDSGTSPSAHPSQKLRPASVSSIPQNRHDPKIHVQGVLHAMHRSIAMKGAREECDSPRSRAVGSSPASAAISPSSRTQHQEKSSRPTSRESVHSPARRLVFPRSGSSSTLRQGLHPGTPPAELIAKPVDSPGITESASRAASLVLQQSKVMGPGTLSASSSFTKSNVTKSSHMASATSAQNVHDRPSALHESVRTSAPPPSSKLRTMNSTAPQKMTKAQSLASATTTAGNVVQPKSAAFQGSSHISLQRNVRSRPEVHGPAMSSSRKNIPFDPTRECHACGSLDHFQRECPLRHARMLALEGATPGSASSARAMAAPLARKRDANYEPDEDIDAGRSSIPHIQEPAPSTLPLNKTLPSSISTGSKEAAVRPVSLSTTTSKAPEHAGSTSSSFGSALPGHIPTGPAAGMRKSFGPRPSTHQPSERTSTLYKDATYESSPSPAFAPAPHPQRSYILSAKDPRTFVEPSQKKRKMPWENSPQSVPPSKRHAPSVSSTTSGPTTIPPQGSRPSQAPQARSLFNMLYMFAD
jgi:hypothetical protein